jgi:hypothetical protein
MQLFSPSRVHFLKVSHSSLKSTFYFLSYLKHATFNVITLPEHPVPASSTHRKGYIVPAYPLATVELHEALRRSEAIPDICIARFPGLIAQQTGTAILHSVHSVQGCAYRSAPMSLPGKSTSGC